MEYTYNKTVAGGKQPRALGPGAPRPYRVKETDWAARLLLTKLAETSFLLSGLACSDGLPDEPLEDTINALGTGAPIGHREELNIAANRACDLIDYLTPILGIPVEDVWAPLYRRMRRAPQVGPA